MTIWIERSIIEWQINGSIGCCNGEDIQQYYDYLEYAESLMICIFVKIKRKRVIY